MNSPRSGKACALLLGLCFWTTPLLAQQGAAPLGPEPEEPDFFFLTGGPYTQKKNSPQIIWANQWFRDTGGAMRTRDYFGAGRFEWGITSRWEFDLEFGAMRLRESVQGLTILSESGADDLLVGVRYRLLEESFAPFTLSLGPQVIAPVASRRRGLGSGEVGYALDVTAAKDWGGPVFVAASVNLSATPDVPAFADGTGPEFGLSEVNWAAALGWRALERAGADGTNHDVHVLFEWAGTRADEVETGERTRSTAWFFAPGARYGYLSRSSSLTEVGVSFPVGLNGNAPDWGVILQAQFELASLF